MSLAISALMFIVWVVSLASSHMFHGFAHAYLAVAVVTGCASLIAQPAKSRSAPAKAEA